MSLLAGSSLDNYVLLQLKSGLREQQRWLLESIEEAEKTICELGSSDSSHIANAASAQSLELSLTARHNQNRRRLRLIELALERIRVGTFGTCAECGEAIGIKRLQAVPWTSHCIQCEKRHDQPRVFDCPKAPETAPG